MKFIACPSTVIFSSNSFLLVLACGLCINRHPRRDAVFKLRLLVKSCQSRCWQAWFWSCLLQAVSNRLATGQHYYYYYILVSKDRKGNGTSMTAPGENRLGTFCLIFNLFGLILIVVLSFSKTKHVYLCIIYHPHLLENGPARILCFLVGCKPRDPNQTHLPAFCRKNTAFEKQSKVSITSGWNPLEGKDSNPNIFLKGQLI